ncbi:septum site-determining protein MinD [Bacillus sp. B1-b2]|uniref:septum site-determining protein MinD n=1 Tax=Bacillus sp. B1-b2 TaxID=2653201 RepID=UPI001869D30B|nr:septum site-determining protein MinD [Bacillus sp. B1-b2]
MSRIITITSGKGGVGKTTATTNLGISLAVSGYKVCLIDADFGLRNLDVPLGLTNRLILDISDYLNGICSLNHVIVSHRTLKNLHLIPGSKTKLISELDQDLFVNMIQEIKPLYDFILIDSPAGIEGGFFNAVHTANEAIIVTTPDKTALQDADRVIGLLEKQKMNRLSFIVNFINPSKVEIDNIINQLHIDYLGYIPPDPNIIAANNKGIPIALNPNLQSGLLFRKIANHLSKQEYNSTMEFPVTQSKQHFFLHRKLNKFKLSL